LAGNVFVVEKKTGALGAELASAPEVIASLNASWYYERCEEDTMFLKIARVLAPLVALMMLLYTLSGCGSNVSGQADVPANLPDSVQIRIITVNRDQGDDPQVTLRVTAQIQQLYQTMLALPLMPQGIPCTTELGTHYQLTFLHGTQVQAQAQAQRDGCRPVTIAGEKQDRQASQDFWTQLDKAIVAATPVPRPQSLAIQHALQGNQPVQTARITDATKAQRLYSKLLALPQATSSGCQYSSYPTYQLVFQTQDQTIPSAISQTCNTISLDGNYKSPSGLYSLTEQFKQLFMQTLATVTFALAQPDQLIKDVSPAGQNTTTHGQVTDTQLMQQLYARIFTLKQDTVETGCPSTSDKVNRKANRYHLSFTQWGLPIMSLAIYEGSCKLVQPSPGVNRGQTLIGDADFWDLVHRIVNA
jgi:hypothetical protein